MPVTPPPSDWDTCEQEFWQVMQNRAAQEAQREVTQNQNLIARPDSILSLTCFDQQLNHVARYADRNFPGDPRFSDGHVADGDFTDMFVVDVRDAVGNSIDPYWAGLVPSPIIIPIPSIDPIKMELIPMRGAQLQHLLEILVLDSLVDNVTTTGAGFDVAALGCDKDYYIDDNEYLRGMIGNRLNDSLRGDLNDGISLSDFNGCQRMNNVWNEAKCYNFQESRENPVVAGQAGAARITTGHDGFFTFEQYGDTEAAGSDYRRYPQMCDDDPPSAGDLACWANVHGLPSPNINAFIPFPGTAAYIYAPSIPWTLDSGNPVFWSTTNDRAAPDPNAPGALDATNQNLALFNSAACGSVQPIRTGMIVHSAVLNRRYYDAVCPAPGCNFDPPATLTGTGTCVP